MIQIKLNEKERGLLIEYRKNACSEEAEHALMVLMNDEGISARKIAVTLIAMAR